MVRSNLNDRPNPSNQQQHLLRIQQNRIFTNTNLNPMDLTPNQALPHHKDSTDPL